MILAIRTIKLKRTDKSWDDSELTAKTLQFGEPLYNANSDDLAIGSVDSVDGQSIGSVTKFFHAVPKTLKGKALYLDGNALKNEDEATVTINAASNISGVLPIANGGTGANTSTTAADNILSGLRSNQDTGAITDNMCVATTKADGDTDGMWYQRPISYFWNYIKGKADAVYAALQHTHSAREITSGLLPVARGGTGADYPLGANNNLRSWSLSVGSGLLAREDLNTYKTEGNYSCSATATAKTLLNTPYGNASSSMPAFLMKVVYSATSTSYIRQELFEYSTFKHWVRYSGNSGSTWGDWSLYTYKPGTAAVGSANQPAYVEASGNIAAVSTVNVAYGGTGRNTLTSNAVLSGNGTGQVNMTATANGAAYSTAANGALKFGTLPVAQGGTGVTSLTALKTSLGIDSIGVWYAGTSAPSNTNLLWIDTNTTTGGLKYYKNSTAGWVHVPVAFV